MLNKIENTKLLVLYLFAVFFNLILLSNKLVVIYLSSFSNFS